MNSPDHPYIDTATTNVIHFMYQLYINVSYCITDTGNNSFINKSLNSTLQNITWREDFIINNTCQPRHDRFEQGTHTGSQLLIYIYLELIASCLGLLLCIQIVRILIKDFKECEFIIYNMNMIMTCIVRFSYPSLVSICSH